MDTNQSMQPYEPVEITPAVETFGVQLTGYLDQVGLPKDDILVPFDRRRPVFQNMPTVLDYLSSSQKSSAAYISKFVAAVAVGLFDAALNYLWDETVKNLREKVAKFDIDYFFNSVVDDPNRRSKLRGEADLEKINDWELIVGCQKTGIITPIGYQHLDYVRNMRNYASAAHPNQNEITGLQLVAWLETCISEVLAKEPVGPVIEVRRLLESLRTERLAPEQVQPIATALEVLPEDLAGSLLRNIVGMYTDERLDVRVKDNVRLVAKSVWEVAPEEARQEVGLKQATLEVNGEVSRSNLAREFIEVVGGLEFLSDTTLVSELANALDGLLTAHHGWYNFYAEPAPAKLLFRLVPRSGEIPKAVLGKYVKTLVMCRIGNGYGTSWAAESYYDEMIDRFSDPQIVVFINLVHDSEIASRLQFSSCADRFQSLAAKLEERAVRPRIKELLSFIKQYEKGKLRKIASDQRYQQLRKTLQL